MSTNQRETAEATLHHQKLPPSTTRNKKSDGFEKKIVRSEDLFGDHREIIIEHGTVPASDHQSRKAYIE